MQVKKIVSTSSQMPMGGVLFLITISLYFFTNNHFLGKPAFVPISVFDIWAVHSPVWIWVYVTYYFYLIGIYISVRNEQVLNQIYYSYLAAGIAGAIIFFFFPSTVLRELYPLSQQPDISEKLLGFIRSIDSTLNCAPSMHVAFSTIAGLAFWRDRSDFPKLRLAVAAWAVMIFYSTMATKQHYFLDVVTGFILGALIFFGIGKLKIK